MENMHLSKNGKNIQSINSTLYNIKELKNKSKTIIEKVHLIIKVLNQVFNERTFKNMQRATTSNFERKTVPLRN